MAFELSQLQILMRTANGNMHVEVLPEEVRKYLGCKQRFSFLSSKSLRHFFEDHPELHMIEVLHLPDLIRRGMWLTERAKPKVAIGILVPEEGPYKYAAAIKNAADGYENYISGFYRIRERDIRSKMRRGEIIRPHLR